MFTESLAYYGGPTIDQIPVIDPTTDRSAAGMNQALSSVGGMTRTAVRAWARIQISSGPTVAIVLWDALWGNGTNAAPTISRSGAGIYVLQWPGTVFDDIPTNLKGFSGTVPGATPAGFSVLLRSAWGGCVPSGSSDDFDVQCVVTGAAQVTAYIRDGAARTLSDPTAPMFDLFAA